MKRVMLIGASLASVLLGGVASARDLVMGLIPAENNEEMVKKFEPMRAHLEKKIGARVKVFTATDYAGVIEAMRNKRVDIAWFGPLSYYLAELEAGAEAFAVGVRRDGKTTYKSIFVVPTASRIQSLKDLQGKTVAFVDPASTSGGLMPAYLIRKEMGMPADKFFGKLVYAGSHDAAELAVKNKTVDAAADNDITYERMTKAGLISAETNRILYESPDLPGSPLVFRGGLEPELRAKIKDAVLNAHAEIKVTGYGELLRYEAASPADYQVVRDMVRELGLKKEQLK